MFTNQHQQQPQPQPQRFRCPGCSVTSETKVFIPNGAGHSACPSCGLTEEEGQRKFNDELSAMFSQGMRLNSGDVPPPIITSATITAIGGSGGGGSHGGLLSAGPTTSAAPSGLGYNSSQHYHHSAHLMPAAPPRPSSAPGFVESNGGGSGGPGDDMQMEGTMQQETEPYMRSGYEYLAERDYNRQAPGHTERVHATDPAFSSKEWWRDFHPIEFQYGVFQQMRDRENEVPKEDDQMRMW